MHPLRRAIEAGDEEATAAALADGVVFYGPLAFKPYRGKAAVGSVLTAVGRVLEDLRYESELASADGREHVVVFGARVGDTAVEGCDFLHHDERGLVDRFMVMVCPLSAAVVLRERMGEALGAGDPLR